MVETTFIVVFKSLVDAELDPSVKPHPMTVILELAETEQELILAGVMDTEEDSLSNSISPLRMVGFAYVNV